jgi:branched-chain amino acid transport system substrate-binding protein
MRTSLGWVPGLALVALAAGCGGKAPEPIRIGHLAPLSGPGRDAGEHARQGIQLAVEEWNADAANGPGRKVAALHVDIHDDEAAQAEAVRLLSVNRVAALIVGPDGALAETAARAAGPYEAAVVLPGELAAPPAGVFAVGASPSQRGRALARFARRDLPPGRAGVLTDGRAPVAAALASAFRKAGPQDDATASFEWTYGKDKELATQVQEAAQAKPGVVLVAGPADDLRKAGAALRAAGLRVPLLYGGPDVGPAALEGGPPAAPDVYLATAYAPEGLTDAGKDFARRYGERFHAAPDLHAALAYDGTRLILAALRQVPDVTPARLRARLAQREPFESVTGPLTWKDGQPRRPLFLLRLENNRPKFVKALGPEGD